MQVIVPGGDAAPAERPGHDGVGMILGLLLGVGVGWIDLHTTEVIVTVLSLIGSGMLAGFAQPRATWRWAILIAVGVPLMAAVAELSGMSTAEPAQLDLRILLVALAFAMAGSYAGALLRRAVRLR